MIMLRMKKNQINYLFIHFIDCIHFLFFYFNDNILEPYFLKLQKEKKYFFLVFIQILTSLLYIKLFVVFYILLRFSSIFFFIFNFKWKLFFYFLKNFLFISFFIYFLVYYFSYSFFISIFFILRDVFIWYTNKLDTKEKNIPNVLSFLFFINMYFIYRYMNINNSINSIKTLLSSIISEGELSLRSFSLLIVVCNPFYETIDANLFFNIKDKKTIFDKCLDFIILHTKCRLLGNYSNNSYHFLKDRSILNNNINHHFDSISNILSFFLRNQCNGHDLRFSISFLIVLNYDISTLSIDGCSYRYFYISNISIDNIDVSIDCHNDSVLYDVVIDKDIFLLDKLDPSLYETFYLYLKEKESKSITINENDLKKILYQFELMSSTKNFYKKYSYLNKIIKHKHRYRIKNNIRRE